MSSYNTRDYLSDSSELYKEYIGLITGEGGAGKSRHFSQLAVQLTEEEPNKKICIKVQNHELIRSIKKWIPDTLISHWQGFTRSCPLYKSKDRVILLIRKLSDEIKCEHYCKKQHNDTYENCPRRLAFISEKPIHIMPVNYVATPQYNFHNWFWSISDDLSWTPFFDTPKEKLQEMVDTYINLIGEEEVECEGIDIDVLIWFSNYDFFNITNKFHEKQLEKREEVIEALTRKKYDKIKELNEDYFLNWNIKSELYQLRKNIRTFGELPFYGKHPFSFELDYKKEYPKTRVSIVGANLNLQLLNLIQQRHSLENNGTSSQFRFFNESINIPEQLIVISKFYRPYINEGARYPVVSMITSPKQINNIKICTQGFLDEFYNGGVGQKIAVIHSKHIGIEKLIYENLNVLKPKTFGVMHGYNLFEHSNIFIVFGMFILPPNSVEELFIRNFGRIPTSTHSEKISDYYKYTEDAVLDIFRKNIIEENHHQIFMRPRPLINPCVVIAWCPVPDSVAQYFDVEEIGVKNYLRGLQVVDTRENWIRQRLQAGVPWSLETWIKMLKSQFPQIRSDRTATNVLVDFEKINDDVEFTFGLRGRNRYRNGLRIINV